MNKINLTRYISFVFFIFLSITTVLSFFEFSICKSSGCEIAGSIINIDKTYLYLLGMFSAIIIFNLSSRLYSSYYKYCFLKNKEYIEVTLNTLILISFVFEAIMFSFLLISTGEVCFTCLITFVFISSLFIINFSYLKFLSILISILISLILLSVKEETTLNFDNKKYILVQSEKCSHCKVVKKYFSENNIDYQKVDVNEYKGLFKQLNIKNIPVLLEQSTDGYNVLIGDKAILDKFNKESDTSILFDIPLSNNDIGCTISESDCEK